MRNIREKGTLIVTVDDRQMIRVGRVDHWEGDILTMQRADQEREAGDLFFEKFRQQKPGIYLWLDTGISLRLTFRHGDRAGDWHRMQVNRSIAFIIE